MKRCVIFGGAASDREKMKKYISPDDFIICCDSGLSHAEGLGITPDLIVGDFDSHEKPVTDTETIVLPCEKDDTDTVFAVKEAVKRGFTDFLLLGVVGQRFDHTFGNISILLWLDSRKLKGKIIDDYSEMEVVSSDPAFIGEEFSYFSVLAVGGDASGVTIENAKYPLDDFSLSCDHPIGVSNEVLPGKTAQVKVKKGRLLLVKVF